jgi:hypothetical protein
MAPCPCKRTKEDSGSTCMITSESYTPYSFVLLLPLKVHTRVGRLLNLEAVINLVINNLSTVLDFLIATWY